MKAGISLLRQFLRRHRQIALDTSVFIYQIESNPRYVGLCGEVFAWIAQSPNRAVTSSLTITELLVAPYRMGDEALVNQYYGLLATYPNLRWISPDLEIADEAARLRAKYRLRTPDALQAATALRSGATALLTNDAGIARVTEIEVACLDAML